MIYHCFQLEPLLFDLSLRQYVSAALAAWAAHRAAADTGPVSSMALGAATVRVKKDAHVEMQDVNGHGHGKAVQVDIRLSLG